PQAIDTLIALLKDQANPLSKLQISRMPDRLDSIWNFPSKEEMKSYRDEIDKIYYQEFKWYDVISNAPEYERHLQQKDTALQRQVLIHLLQRRLFDYENFAATVKANVKYVVKGDITYSLDSVANEISTPDTDGDGHQVKVVTDLDVQLQDIGETIDQLLEYDSTFLTLKELESTNDRIMRHWEVEQEEVDTLLYKMKSQWRLIVGEDTTNIQRYSTWYSYLSGDTLAADFMRMFQKSVKADREKLKKLETEKLKKLILTEVKTTNSSLDLAWFYPSKEKLNEFQQQVERTKHGAVSRGTREKLQAVEKEAKIQRHVLRAKEAARKAMFEIILDKAKVIEQEDGRFMNKAAGNTNVSML
ncbi:MAG: hypothetical protein AAFO69_10505, partial [Bacteroidota bacterium]